MNDSADPATVLVIEDDAGLAVALEATLKAAGYRAVRARTAGEGVRWFNHYAPDLVLLDLGLPDRDGLTVITELRERGSTTPLIVLSARGAEAMKVRALDLGADDYVSKPFGVDELLARLRAGLRHGVQTRGSEPVVTAGDLVIDLGLRTVTVAGEAVKLSPKEYDLLAELAINQGRVLGHKQLLAAVWGSERADIQNHRNNNNQKHQMGGIERIVSEPGVGYALHP